jgi:hypothetical protein
MFRKKENRKVDYNIEYAHIYADKSFGNEQIKSVEKLKKVTTELDKKKKSYVSVVLIDDYNPEKCSLDNKKFLERLGNLGPKPDFVGFESRLYPDKDFILKEMSSKKRREYENYIEKSKKIPCSLFIAIWYLKRLGFIKTRNEELIPLNKKNKPFVAKNIITILPEEYRDVEKKGLKIIESTRFNNCLNNISDIFFKIK